MAQRHRASSLKQQNKAHKTGKHKSNRSLDNASRGRTAVSTLAAGKRRAAVTLRRHERRQQLRQLRANKQLATAGDVERLQGIDPGAAPLLVALVSVHETVCSGRVLRALAAAAAANENVKTSHSLSQQNIVHLSVSCGGGQQQQRRQRRFNFVAPPAGDLHATLDAAKTADLLVFAMPAEIAAADGAIIDAAGELLLSAALAHGVAASCPLLVTDSAAAAAADQSRPRVSGKRERSDRKRLVRRLQRWWPASTGECRRLLHVLPLDNAAPATTTAAAADVRQLLHQWSGVRRRAPDYRRQRTHMLADSVAFTDHPQQAGVGTLHVTGFLRGGRGLSASQLVHVCGWGDFQMSHVTSATAAAPGHDAGEPCVLSRADPSVQVSLQSENVADVQDVQMDDTCDRMLDAETFNRVARRVRAPAGMSEYQAAWIVDSDAEVGDDIDDDEGEEDGGSDGCHDNQPAPEDDMSDAGSYDDRSYCDSDEDAMSNAHADADKYDAQMNLDEEEATLNNIQAEREDELFPDELDTPRHVAARRRFHKYRGLASLRTSTWDVSQDRPPADLSRCFRLGNVHRSRRRALAAHSHADAVPPGQYVTLHIINVPAHLYLTLRQRQAAIGAGTECCVPLVVFALLPHEQRMSMLNCAVRRHRSAAAAVANKAPLVFHVGCRRFSAAPVFSQHTNGENHKMERFFRADTTLVATVYAPIMYGPAPVLVTRDNELVASGSLLSVNTDRIVLKRMVLSGHPYKVHKRSAVIRYMFFNRDDILWFKPVELRTKLGRRGNIKEPLGTHGHMKVVFNAALSSQDTVLMTLYKRVFPRWTYEPLVAPPPALYSNSGGKRPLPTVIEECDSDEELGSIMACS